MIFFLHQSQETFPGLRSHWAHRKSPQIVLPDNSMTPKDTFKSKSWKQNEVPKKLNAWKKNNSNMNTWVIQTSSPYYIWNYIKFSYRHECYKTHSFTQINILYCTPNKSLGTMQPVEERDINKTKFLSLQNSLALSRCASVLLCSYAHFLCKW